MAALMVHSGRIVSPVLVIAAFWPKQRWRLFVAAGATLTAAIYDVNPFFWLSVRCGVLLSPGWSPRFCAATSWPPGPHLLRRSVADFLRRIGAIPLPIAAPVAILAARIVAPLAHGRIRAAADTFAGIGNRELQHWDGYRQFAETLAPDAAHIVSGSMPNGACATTWIRRRSPLARDQPVQPGDTIVSSELAQPVTVNAPVAQVSAAVIVPSVPLRLISLSRFGLLSAAGGLLPSRFRARPRIVCAPIWSSSGNLC